jgi:hypothetical protein
MKLGKWTLAADLIKNDAGLAVKHLELETGALTTPPPNYLDGH